MNTTKTTEPKKRNRVKKLDAVFNLKVSSRLHDAVKQYADFHNTTISEVYRIAALELLNKGKNEPLES